MKNNFLDTNKPVNTGDFVTELEFRSPTAPEAEMRSISLGGGPGLLVTPCEGGVSIDAVDIALAELAELFRFLALEIDEALRQGKFEEPK